MVKTITLPIEQRARDVPFLVLATTLSAFCRGAFSFSTYQTGKRSSVELKVEAKGSQSLRVQGMRQIENVEKIHSVQVVMMPDQSKASCSRKRAITYGLRCHVTV